MSKHTDALRICRLDHGGSMNAAKVYGHPGSLRTCVRLRKPNVWVYDPRWEVAR